MTWLVRLSAAAVMSLVALATIFLVGMRSSSWWVCGRNLLR